MDDVLVRPQPRARFPAANVVLFVATIATTLWAGFGLSPLAAHAPSFANVVLGGLPFAGSLVAILFIHEMGHYVLARRYRVDTTLPYFIPVPFGVGTLGAVIRMRSALPSRRATLDIGASGPIAGFVVAVPLLVWGLAHSEVRELGSAAVGASELTSPFTILRALLDGRSPVMGDGAVQLMGDSAITWAAQRLVLGELPPGHDVFLHPVAFAAWLGLLITALNLVPAGQLDGGHVLYALLGRKRALVAAHVVSVLLFLAGVFLSWNWLIWWFLTRFVVGLGHPRPVEDEPLDRRRLAIALVSLAIFAVTFVPVPVSL
jgi:membrane-associated protease RseP (regulator of RpoE activity)